VFPSREKTFKLENCRDLYNKLRREVDRFNKDLTDPMVRADHAFNAVVTAWHLCDWVFADLTLMPELQDKLGIKTKADLQAAARKCRALHLCQQACNASKHWAVTMHNDPTVDTVVTIAPFDPSKDDVHAPIKFDVFFKDGDKFIKAEQVFEDAIQFWTDFIYKNQIAPD